MPWKMGDSSSSQPAMSLPVLAPRLAGVTPPVVEKPSSKEHTEAEWEAKRELIQKLYIQDNRKLSETMAILESKHGFAATWVYPPLEKGVRIAVPMDMSTDGA